MSKISELKNQVPKLRFKIQLIIWQFVAKSDQIREHDIWHLVEEREGGYLLPTSSAKNQLSSSMIGNPTLELLGLEAFVAW